MPSANPPPALAWMSLIAEGESGGTRSPGKMHRSFTGIRSADPQVAQRIIGLTSPANVAFVERLGCCDDVVTYGEEANIDATVPAAYVDMSGDARLTAALHNLMGKNMVVSTMVGATHWEQRGDNGALPGAKPTFFFAPAQIGKRDADWGPGVALM